MEIGEKVYTITDSLEKDSGLKLYEAEVIKDVETFCPLLDFGGEIGRGYFPALHLCFTAEEALEHAYSINQKEQTKLAEQYQDLMRIEAELKLKDKGENK